MHTNYSNIYSYIYNNHIYNHDLSDYENSRNANIVRNDELLIDMGLNKREKGHTHEVPKQSSGGESTI